MTALETCSLPMLASQLQIGDVVFIRVMPKPFREVASTTNSWTNHIGVVIDNAGDEPTLAESTFPLSRKTSLSAFIRRSDRGRVAVCRLKTPPTTEQRGLIREAAVRRLNVIYDTGFNLRSRRQFCSRLVREVLNEATGIAVGEVQTFSSLLGQHPGIKLGFWRWWFFGRIPWRRETVSPASVLSSPALRSLFDGRVAAATMRSDMVRRG